MNDNSLEELLPKWNAHIKLKAISHRFYQGAKWEPKLGDLYCITRDGLMLCQIVKWENGEISHQTLFDDKGNEASSWDLTVWDETEFLYGSFMNKRCHVPLWALE